MDCPENHVIFNEGDQGEEMYYILEGEVALTKYVEGRNIEVARLKAGDIFGEMALIRNQPRTTTATTTMPTRLLKITKDNFAEKMKGNSEFAFHLLKSLTQRLEDTTNELMMLKFVISG